jgi:carbamate kinase
MRERDSGSSGRRFVIALGGNAIIPSGHRGTFDEQRELTRQTMDQVAELSRNGHEIVLTHGNGPVVGNIVLRGAAGLEKHGIPPMPLYVCGADSQGGIGFMIQQALQNSLRACGIQRPVAALVTQVIVDRDDPAFEKPTKPIGPFYTAEQAAQLRRENGWTVVEDAHRGWRRVVPSPQPIEVVEWEVIRAMIQAGIIAIAAGGGGVPVARDDAGELRGIDAVIDKDRASALLGRLIGADTLVIVTSVERVFRAFGTPQAQPLSHLTAAEAKQLLDAGEFPTGSMGPKIEAALAFLADGGRRVLITSSGSILRGLEGGSGTWIESD